MENKKIIELLKEMILSKEELIKNYKLIGFFGSCLNSDNFFDVDLITIGKNQTHQTLKKELKKELSRYHKTIIFFKSVKNQPISKKENEILIHDLHYSSLRDLYQKEWKDIINEIKNSTKVIYGSKRMIKKIKINEKDFYSLWLNWTKKISNEKRYNNFKKYLKKTMPKLYKIHPKLNLKFIGNEILKILLKRNWKKNIKKIKEILKKQLKNKSNKKLAKNS